MQARTYISLQSASFDPQAFHAQVGSAVLGEVRRRKHSGAPLANVPLDYWASTPSLGAPDDVGSRLSKLLQTITPFIQRLPEKAGLRIFAHVVLEFDQGEEPVGLYFSKEVIQLLQEIGAELDIDAVPRI